MTMTFPLRAMALSLAASLPNPARAEPLKVLLPDLVVSNISVTYTRFYIKTVKVTVKEICNVDTQGDYYVSLLFVSGKNIGNEGPPVKAGKSASQTFNVLDQRIIAQSFVRAEVNPYKTITEDTTANNWLQITPNAGPVPVSGVTHCKPKPYYFWFPIPGL